jgi:hypothetical protein
VKSGKLIEIPEATKLGKTTKIKKKLFSKVLVEQNLQRSAI